MILVITRTRAHRGSSASDQPSSFESSPGRRVPFDPSAARLSRATVCAETVAPMVMLARDAKPLCTGPGAHESTATPYGASSTPSPSARDCTYALVAA